MRLACLLRQRSFIWYDLGRHWCQLGCSRVTSKSEDDTQRSASVLDYMFLTWLLKRVRCCSQRAAIVVAYHGRGGTLCIMSRDGGQSYHCLIGGCARIHGSIATQPAADGPCVLLDNDLPSHARHLLAWRLCGERRPRYETIRDSLHYIRGTRAFQAAFGRTANEDRGNANKLRTCRPGYAIVLAIGHSSNACHGAEALYDRRAGVSYDYNKFVS